MKTPVSPPQAGLAAVALLWLGLILTAPSLGRAESPAFRGLSAAVYAAASAVCHQRPDRSFLVHERPLPVCGRCTGLYLGAAVAALAAAARRGTRVPAGRARPLLVVAAAPACATLVLEWMRVADVSNGARAASGVVLGAVTAWLIVAVVNPAPAAVELH